MNNVLLFPRTRQKAEIAVLAILLFAPSEENRHLAAQLRPDNFQEPQLAVIFEAMQWLMNQGEAIDIFTVAERLEETGKLEDAGGRVMVMDLAMCVHREEKMTEQVRLLSGPRVAE